MVSILSGARSFRLWPQHDVKPPSLLLVAWGVIQGGAVNRGLKRFFHSIGLYILLRLMFGLKNTGWCGLDPWLTIHSILTSFFLATAQRVRRKERHVWRIYTVASRQRWADRYFGPLVRWSDAQRTTEMLADQRTGKNSGPAPADYRN